MPSLRDEVGRAPNRADGSTEQVPLTLCIDTHRLRFDYYLHGGILPYVLRQLLAGTTGF